jgi:hypothetical protein
MRILSARGQAALLRNPTPLALLVEMDLSAPLFISSAPFDLTFGGTTWVGSKGLGKLDAVKDSPAEIAAMGFEISGVSNASLALALTEPVQGRAARIKLALFDPDQYDITDVDLLWAGRLDVMTIDRGFPVSSIKVTAEHFAVDFVRSIASLYSDAEQRRLYPGDPSFQYVVDQVEMRIVWPDREFFRQ